MERNVYLPQTEEVRVEEVSLEEVSLEEDVRLEEVRLEEVRSAQPVFGVQRIYPESTTQSHRLMTSSHLLSYFVRRPSVFPMSSPDVGRHSCQDDSVPC